METSRFHDPGSEDPEPHKHPCAGVKEQQWKIGVMVKFPVHKSRRYPQSIHKTIHENRRCKI
jgi:hypothetical protein